MGLVEDWQTMTPAELTTVVRKMAREFRPEHILRAADDVVEGETVETVDEDVGALDLMPRRHVIVQSEGFPKFRLVRRKATAGHRVLLLQVKAAPPRDWRTLAAVRVSKRPRVIDEDEP